MGLIISRFLMILLYFILSFGLLDPPHYLIYAQQQVPAQQPVQQQPSAMNQQVPVPQQQYQQAPTQQQQFQQPPQQFQQPPVQQQLNQPPQQQFQQPPSPTPQQQQFQQPRSSPPQQQFQQPVQQQFQQPPPQQQFQQPPPPPQQFQQPPPPPQQFQQPPPPPQQFQQPPPPPPHRPPPPPERPPPPPGQPPKAVPIPQPKKKPPPLRKEQKVPPKHINFEAINMPSAERFQADMAPSKSYVYLTAIVASGARDCYFYNPLIDFNLFVQVISGGDFDIAVMVFDPNSRIIATEKQKKEHNLKFEVLEENTDQAYAICLDNRKASNGAKTVYVSLDLDINFDNPSEREKEILEAMRSFYNETSSTKQETQENVDRFNDLLDSISARIRRVNLLAARTRNVNTVDRITMSRNHERVSSWSLFQIVVMLLVAIFQTAFIRNLFEGGRISIWHSLFTPTSSAIGRTTFARA